MMMIDGEVRKTASVHTLLTTCKVKICAVHFPINNSMCANDASDIGQSIDELTCWPYSRRTQRSQRLSS